MRFRMPAYIPIMVLVTAAYLTVEIPFSVHLVEVMGGNPSQQDIDGIESFGRVLTGIAVSIWIVGALVFPRMHARGRGFLLSAVFALAVSSAATWSTYMVLDAVATGTGRSANGTERKEAYLDNLARRYIGFNGKMGDLADTGTNDWQAFVSVAPALSRTASLAAATGVGLSELARMEAARIVGTQQEYRGRVFGEGFRSVRDSYQEYAEGSEAYRAAMAALPGDAEKAWRAFRSEVESRYPGGVRRNSYTETFIIRHVLFTMKIPVDGNRWTITDRGGFVRPYMKVAAGKIDAAYRDGLERSLGAGQWIKPGLGMDGFAAHPAVQRRIIEALDLPPGGGAVTPGMDDSSFRGRVYLPKLASMEREMIRATAAPASEFESGEFAVTGIEAVRAARLPAMAVLLSIAGAALHIFKLSGYLAQMAGFLIGASTLAQGHMRHAVGAAAATACFCFMGFSGNGITAKTSYAALKGDGVYASLLHAAIAIQPEFSALGRTIGGFGGWQAFASGIPAPVAASRPPVPAPGTSPQRSHATLPDGPAAPLPTWRPQE